MAEISCSSHYKIYCIATTKPNQSPTKSSAQRNLTRVSHTTQIITIPLPLPASQINCYFFPECLLENMSIPQNSKVTHTNCAAIQQNVYRVTGITWQWRSAPRSPSRLSTQMFFCCSLESWDKQMLQHFKMFIFSKRQLSTYLHVHPLQPHTSDMKPMSIMYQIPFRRNLSDSLFLQQSSRARSLQILPLHSHGHKWGISCLPHSFVHNSLSLLHRRAIKARPKVHLSSIQCASNRRAPEHTG